MLRNGKLVEQLRNGSAKPTVTASPSSAYASSRTTRGLDHSHKLGHRDSEASPPVRGSSSRPTLNSYHANGSLNRVTALRTTREGSRPRTAWDLPALAHRPLPIRHRPTQRHGRMLPHYPAVVEFVYQNRYVTAVQVQRRFATWLRSPRTAQYQLASLVQAGYLGTAPVRAVGPNFPFVFRATQQGINLVRDAYARLGIDWTGTKTEEGRQSGAGNESVLHELLLSEVVISLETTIQSRPDLASLFIERRYFRSDRVLSYFDRGRTRRVVPDAGFLVRIADGPAILSFLEFDNGTMAPARIAEKYRHYDRWAQSDAGQRYLADLFRRYSATAQRPNFRLVVIPHANKPAATDDGRLLNTLQAALDLPASMRDRIWLTTVEALRRHQDDAAPWQAPVWLRVRDARTWPARPGRPTSADRKRQLDHLASLPRHPFFPHAAGNRV